MQLATSPSGDDGMLNFRDESILHYLHRYHYLLSRQVCRLLYSSNSISYVQTRLKRLTDQGYCQRIWLPKRGSYGSSPAVYTLARRGINHLKTAGLDTMLRHRPSEQETRSYMFLTHALELNDFLISAELLCRWVPEFELANILHERDLRHERVYVKDQSGRQWAVIPDAWVDLRIRGSFNDSRVCLAIELDRGSEGQTAWRRKVANLLAYANGPYQEKFGTRSLTVAVVTTAGDRRLLELLKWTKNELEARQEAGRSDLFLFTSALDDSMDAERLFLKPCWYQPLNDSPLALLEIPWT